MLSPLPVWRAGGLQGLHVVLVTLKVLGMGSGGQECWLVGTPLSRHLQSLCLPCSGPVQTPLPPSLDTFRLLDLLQPHEPPCCS